MPADSIPRKICFAYLWATSGGVERVFLSRSEALLRTYPELVIDVYFYNDSGGTALFTRYIKARNLGDRLTVVKTFDPARYDAVFSVDTPQVLVDHPSIHDKVFMECHTPYPAHRTYLKQWQHRLRLLIVPSAPFQQVIETECPALRGKIKVVRNFVPKLPETDRLPRLPEWRAPLFLYLGRIDHNKNTGEFVEGLSRARRQLGRDPLGIVCGPLLADYPLKEIISRHKAGGLVALLPPVPFENSHMLLQQLRQKRAVYVSSSKGESFGLSVAEAMTAGMPVVLSDIPPHATLVSGRSKFLYRLGRIDELTEKMAEAIRNYDEFSAECGELSRTFGEENFLADWRRVFEVGS